jgi:hypothetical protein
MFSTSVGYKLIASDLTAALKRTASQPNVERESAYYMENIGNIKSIDDFIGNDRIFKYAMKAFGLQDMDYAKAFMRKVLAEGIDDSKSFANSLTDTRYKEFAETFNFKRYSTGATVFTRAQQGTVDRYVRQTLEVDAGQSNEGVRLALYFQRKAEGVETPFHLMADRALLKVTQVALGIPEATGTMDIDRQAKMISSKLDIEDLKEPAKLDKFLERFVALWELENPTSSPSAGIIQLVNPQSNGIGMDLLQQIQNIRNGR